MGPDVAPSLDFLRAGNTSSVFLSEPSAPDLNSKAETSNWPTLGPGVFRPLIPLTNPFHKSLLPLKYLPLKRLLDNKRLKL